AAGARPVLDDDVLAEDLGELLSDDTGGDVAAGAGGEADDEVHRTGWVIALRQRRQRGEKQGGCGGERQMFQERHCQSPRRTDRWKSGQLIGWGVAARVRRIAVFLLGPGMVRRLCRAADPRARESPFLACMIVIQTRRRLPGPLAPIGYSGGNATPPRIFSRQ